MGITDSGFLRTIHSFTLFFLYLSHEKKTAHFLASLLIVLSGTFLTFSNVTAQCPAPAPNDYPWIPFLSESAVTIETPLGSGCFTTYEWCWRSTPFNGGEVEIYIGKISRSGNCGPYDINDLIRIAARYVIVEAKPWESRDGGAGHTINIKIPPCPAQSRLIYRILHSSCYSIEFFDKNLGRTTRIPCGDGNNGRCEEAWRVCWELLPDGTPHLNETLVEIVNNGATCPATTNNVSGQPVPCLRICN